MNPKIVDNGNGRYDEYSNGLGGRADGLHHDHLFAHYRKDGSITQSGFVDRSSERDALARGLGRTALGGFFD